MPTVTLNDLDIYYETQGDPAHPPLIIVAGLGDPAGKCAWQSGALAERFYVVVFDNRGVGRSSKPAPGYSAADMAGDVAALLDHLGLQQVHVFGFSLGGMIAQHLALTRPELVGRLALGCTTAGGTLWTPPEEEVALALAHPQSSGDPYQDYLAGMWLSVTPGFVADSPEVIQALAELSAKFPQPAASYKAQIDAALSHDVAAQITGLKMPVLVLHGDADRMIPPQNGLDLARTIPDAALVLYPEAGHLFFIEEAAAVNRDLQAFFLAEGDEHGR